MLAASINKYTDNTFLDISLNTTEDSVDTTVSKIDKKTILGQPLGQLAAQLNRLKKEDLLYDMLKD
jgi:hypothetical protein